MSAPGEEMKVDKLEKIENNTDPEYIDPVENVEQRKNHELGLVVKNEEEIQKIVDVAVLLDGTGSMGYEIQAAAETMISNVTLLKNKYPNCVFRVALVVYRDYDESDEFVILDFSENVDTMVQVLKGQMANGGGDSAENVAGGLAHLLDLSWKGDICQVFWVADAPAHGDRYHVASVSDYYRDGDRNGLDPEELVWRMAQKNIGISFFKMNTTTDKMINVLDESYQRGRIPGNKSNFIVADVSEQLIASKSKKHVHDHHGGLDYGGYCDVGTYDEDATYDPVRSASMEEESGDPINLFSSPSAMAYQEQFIAAVSLQME